MNHHPLRSDSPGFSRTLSGAGQDRRAQNHGDQAQADLESAWLDNVHIVSEDVQQTDLVAKALDVEPGALVHALVCLVGTEPVLVLMAGDMPCDPAQIARVRNARGSAVTRLNAAQILDFCENDALTAHFPVALSTTMPTIMDASLQRFDALYTRAGAPTCYVRTTYGELKIATQATISYALAPSDWRKAARTSS